MVAGFSDKQCGCNPSGREERELHAFLIWLRNWGEAVRPFKVWCSPPAQWLPIWVTPEMKGFACGTGRRLAILSGQLSHQCEVSVGPIFRF